MGRFPEKMGKFQNSAGENGKVSGEIGKAPKLSRRNWDSFPQKRESSKSEPEKMGKFPDKKSPKQRAFHVFRDTTHKPETSFKGVAEDAEKSPNFRYEGYRATFRNLRRHGILYESTKLSRPFFCTLCSRRDGSSTSVRAPRGKIFERRRAFREKQR
jgi:hypothetical protein